MLLIVLNTLLLMMKVYNVSLPMISVFFFIQNLFDPEIYIFFPKIKQYHGQGDTYGAVLRYINMVFTGLFTIEATLKIFGFGLKVCTVDL